MRKILLLSLAFILAACGAVQPVQQPAPEPVIATVLVTAVPPVEDAAPTPISLPTEAPTDIPAPVEAPTDIPAPTATIAAAQPPASAADITPVLVDDILGKGVFRNIQLSNNIITLNCVSREITVTLTSSLPDVERAEMFYRIVETKLARASDWYLIGNMLPDGNGNFSITFKATDINPNYRVYEKAWVDLQFAGVNKGGGVVDRTQKIERLLTYYKECP
jgi:hypothetical protein